MKKIAIVGLSLASALCVGISFADDLSGAQPQQVQAAQKKYTKQHIAKLKLGMSKKKVQHLIGKPDDKTKTQWRYTSTSTSVQSGNINFKKGKITGGTLGSLSKQAKDKKLAPINEAIAKSLKQDQEFAEGTLDENGNPTENGTPNAAFDWSTYVTSIKVTKSSDSYKVDGQVNAKVSALTEDAKKKLAIHIQNLALTSLIELDKAPDEALTEGLFTDVRSGKLAVAQSHLTDYKEIRVY